MEQEITVDGIEILQEVTMHPAHERRDFLVRFRRHDRRHGVEFLVYLDERQGLGPAAREHHGSEGVEPFLSGRIVRRAGVEHEAETHQRISRARDDNRRVFGLQKSRRSRRARH